jgi:hypothetical protein
VVLVADITPAAGLHVYAPGADGYLPVALVIDPPTATIDPVGVRPDPIRKFLTAVNESAPIYEQRFQVTQIVQIPPTVSAGRAAAFAVTGVLKYQACDDRVCYRPEAVKVRWAVPLR